MAALRELSQKEVNQRVMVLKRFKELLKAQRDRFHAYLDALDRSKDVIERGTTDDLLRHIELEEKIVTDIASIQKVIMPLETMYHAARIHGEDVTGLEAALEGLKKEAVVRVGRNKNLLSKRMTEIRSEIKTLRSNPYTQKRTGLGAQASPSLVDIRG
ncbi:MAG: flagellar biosynthesis protein FlgN [Treponema sp.]|jgi:prefoldin subunit 5|nr:flagellar biosynthesis protein FlgN [Treponema sp.]